MRQLLAVRILLPALLMLTAACGGAETPDTTQAQPKEATIADVAVSGPPGEKPNVDFKAPLSFATTESKVIEEGDGSGDIIKPNSKVTIDFVGFNASDAAEYASNYDQEPVSFSLGEVITGMGKGLEGKHAGDRVLVTVASADGFDPNGNGTTVEAGDSLVLVIDVLDVATPLDVATGKKMTAPDTVPTLAYDAQDQPKSFDKTKTTPESVDDLGVYPIIKGEGPRIREGQTLTVHYVGQIYPDGDVFDESWSGGEPATFSLDQVIAGWTQGLTGQTVGSRVILVIPSELGYGGQAQEGIPANSDLIFAVDILAAS